MWAESLRSLVHATDQSFFTRLVCETELCEDPVEFVEDRRVKGVFRQLVLRLGVRLVPSVGYVDRLLVRFVRQVD